MATTIPGVSTVALTLVICLAEGLDSSVISSVKASPESQVLIQRQGLGQAIPPSG